jgi:hypothetical protein
MLRFLERLLGVAHVTVMEDRLTISPLLGEKQELVPVTARLFRERESPAATMALIVDSSEGRLIQADGQTLREVPAGLVWTEVGVGAASLVLMMTSPLFALIWLPRKLSGRMRGVEHIHVRVLPLASVLILAAAVGVLAVSDDDLISRFGNPTLWSVGFCALTVAFAGTAWLGLVQALRVRPPRMSRFAWLHCLLASSSASIVAAYLSYWGVIGIRSWT